jgi:hypothetical protein
MINDPSDPQLDGQLIAPMRPHLSKKQRLLMPEGQK